MGKVLPCAKLAIGAQTRTNIVVHVVQADLDYPTKTLLRLLLPLNEQV